LQTFKTQQGEWLTYLASISLIEEVTTRDGNNQNTNTLISILILVKLLPNVFFLPIGGILADSYDRRRIQIALDLFSSCVVVVFLWSLSSESICLCLVANFLIETSSGLYIPSNVAMLPQLFRGGSNYNGKDDELKKATVLYGMVWSVMAAFGSSLGGILVASFGMKGCFVIDSITYLISALILGFGVQGNYNTSTTQKPLEAEETDDPIDIALSSSSSSSSSTTSENFSLLEEQIRIGKESSQRDRDYGPNDSGGVSRGLLLFVRGLKFLFLEEPLVGACTLLKGSAALTYGAVDVLNVSFSSRGSESDPSKTSLKLGLLFGSVGVGCILGSLITDALSDPSFPRRIVRVCLGGFSCIFVAMFWMAATPDLFVSLCFSTVIRSIGTAIVWINSTLLIQKFTPQNLLGRVSSFDSAVALFAEALSALGGGILMDQNGLSAKELSLILAGVALCFFLFWSPLAFRF
jgi:MFS family permease